MTGCSFSKEVDLAGSPIRDSDVKNIEFEGLSMDIPKEFEIVPGYPKDNSTAYWVLEGDVYDLIFIGLVGETGVYSEENLDVALSSFFKDYSTSVLMPVEGLRKGITAKKVTYINDGVVSAGYGIMNGSKMYIVTIGSSLGNIDKLEDAVETVNIK